MRWRGGYFNGVVTAPLLLLFAIWLAILQLRPPARPPGPFLLKRTLPAQLGIPPKVITDSERDAVTIPG